jgi:hypothetical protein
MKRTFWAGVVIQTISLVAVLVTSDPWTMVSGTVGLLLMTLALYQGADGRRNWADTAVVAVALASIVGPLLQLGPSLGSGALALSGLLVANLGMAVVCAALLAHWLWSAMSRRREPAAPVGAPAR